MNFKIPCSQKALSFKRIFYKTYFIILTKNNKLCQSEDEVIALIFINHIALHIAISQNIFSVMNCYKNFFYVNKFI
jgi:hypothetical protein